MEINWKRPELSDKEMIISYLRKNPGRSCERTFTNIYLWSRHYGVTFAKVGNAIVFRSEDEEAGYAFPAGDSEDVKAAIEVLSEYSREQGQALSFYNVTPEQFEQLEAWYPGRFTVEYERDYADYVYESEKLTTLSGKKLHGKRNHINKFKSLYPNWSYETLSKENVEACFQMALKWRRQNGCEEDEEKNAEMCVTLNSLRLMEELNLTGGVLKVDDEIVAFSIGEEVCEDTFVVHIEKAYAEVEGAYTMINQQFVTHECQKYQYINREEDMGAEGLRKAKLSYRPVFLVEKGIAKEKIV